MKFYLKSGFKYKKKLLSVENLLFIACFFCILSQIPILWNNRLITLIYNLSWFMILFLLIKNDKYRLRIKNTVYFIPVLFDLCLLLMSVLTRKNYLNSNFIRPIHVCLFISIIGYLLGKKCNRNIINSAIKATIYGTAILAFFIFFNTFRGIDWANTSGYLYTAKNSAATIFIVAIILSIIYLDKFNKFFVIVLDIGLSVLIFMLKSRASILCLLLILIYLILFYVKSLRYKVFFVMLFIGAIFYVFYNPSLYDLIINKIMLNNRGSDDITVLTSGRDLHYELFFSSFPTYWKTGTGGTYLECFPLAVLLSYGIVGGLLLISYALLPFVTVLKDIKKISLDKKLQYVVISLNITLIINSIFEEQPPFGPGVKCFTLWLFFGLYLGFKYKERNKIYE